MVGPVSIAALALLTVAMPAEAFLFTGSSLGLSAEVEFAQTGVSGDIVVRLENISANDAAAEARRTDVTASRRSRPGP